MSNTKHALLDRSFEVILTAGHGNVEGVGIVAQCRRDLCVAKAISGRNGGEVRRGSLWIWRFSVRCERSTLPLSCGERGLMYA
jgi:hypothetical protein